MFDFSNYSSSSKCYDDSNALVVGKMKCQMGGVPNEECFGVVTFMACLITYGDKYHPQLLSEETQVSQNL